MNRILTSFLGWFGWGGALGENTGKQQSRPSGSLVDGAVALAPDGAMQLSTVWACVWILANTIASLPLFVYTNNAGKRDLARDELLYKLLHDSPNGRMTPVEFWVAMLLNLLLRGNAYARIERDAAGVAESLWPMSADQVEVHILDDGSLAYLYRVGSNLAVLDESNVLHIKDIGNGTIGLDRLEHMRCSTTEAANSQTAASSLFANGGKPSGILMLDRVLKPEQREAIRRNFASMAEGSTSRLVVLEADMKYEQVTLSPEDQQLLDTRRFTVEELCRWFGVPPVLVGHSNVTAWGSGIEQLIDGFYKFTVRPVLVRIEQAITKRVLTTAQRARFTVEFSFDALLRASLKDRMAIYAQGAQNGIVTRNECRQLENLPPIDGGDELTAQTNLAPLHTLGVPPAPPPDDTDTKATRRIEFKMAEQAALIKSLQEAPAPAPAPVINTTINLVQGETKTNVAVPPAEIKQDIHHHHVTNVTTPEITLPAPIVTNEITVEPTPVTLEATIKNDLPANMTMQVTGLPDRVTTSSVQRDSDGAIVKTTQIERDA